MQPAAASSEPDDHEPGHRVPFPQRLALAVAVALLLLLIGAATEAFLLAFGALLFSIFLCNVTERIAQAMHCSYRRALLLFGVGLLAATAAAVTFLAPGVVAQAHELREALPESWSAAQQRLSGYGWGERIIEAMRHPEDYLPEQDVITRRLAGTFSTTVGFTGAMLLMFFLGVCMAIEPDTYLRGMISLVPIRHRRRAREVMAAVAARLGSWLVAKVISMAIVGVATTAGLWWLEIPLALALGLLAAAMTFVPNIGPVLAAIPAVLLGLVESPAKALYVVVLYVIIQTIESYVLTPYIERDRVALPPALTLSAQVVLGLLTGFLGLLLAAPLAAAAMVLTQMVYVQDVLGDYRAQVDQQNDEES